MISPGDTDSIIPKARDGRGRDAIWTGGEYKPDFRSRGDEARKIFSAKAQLGVGDVFTVGGRRGGSYGFLLVFVRKYGRSALTATYLLVATTIPLYFLLNSSGVLGHATGSDIKRMVLAEFAAASLLICAGALLGRIKMCSTSCWAASTSWGI